jgi:hypothetical protein
MSATKDALDMMERTGCTAYAAAKHFGVTPATLYAAMKKPRCGHCGNYLKNTEQEEKQPKKKTKRDKSLDDLLG